MSINKKFEFAQGGFVVTQSDTLNLEVDAANNHSDVHYAIFTGSGGNIKVRTTDGEDITFVSTVAGTMLPVLAIRVWSTGTAATNVVAIKGH